VLYPVRRLACSELNQALMELGALVCTPNLPDCPQCPVRDKCFAFTNRCVATLPKLDLRRSTRRRRFIALVASRNGRFLVRQRPAGVVNAKLWEFPNVEVFSARPDLPATAAELFGQRPARIQPHMVINHAITQSRISLQVYRVSLNRATARTSPRGIWATAAKLERLAFPSAHRKIAQSLIAP
jgi:A/G-specific adenine glycosylase